jgi:hypothetical protein
VCFSIGGREWGLRRMPVPHHARPAVCRGARACGSRVAVAEIDRVPAGAIAGYRPGVVALVHQGAAGFVHVGVSRTVEHLTDEAFAECVLSAAGQHPREQVVPSRPVDDQALGVDREQKLALAVVLTRVYVLLRWRRRG